MVECRVCGNATNTFEMVANCEYDQFSLKDAPFRSETKEMVLFRCTHCSHVQAKDVLDDSFYDYYTGAEGEDQYYGPMEVSEKKLTKLCSYSYEKVNMFEIGCGMGGMLERAAKFFERCIGIEPSKINYDIAKSKGLEVDNAYFNINWGGSLHLQVSKFLSIYAI